MPGSPDDARLGRRQVVTVTPASLRAWPLPSPGNDKESRGRVLVVGGTRQTPGAILLAAEAALRTGAGKLQVATVASVAPLVAVALPEAAVQGLAETADGSIDPASADKVLELANASAATLLGPGMQDVETSAALMARLVPALDTRVVVDALALSYLTGRRDGVRRLGGRVVLTPNRTELARTLECGGTDGEREVAAMSVELAESTGAVVSSGGPTSWIASPEDGLWQVETGGPGLGVSGSGDVQAGVVLGLLARGADPEQAATWAAYLHGRAGDRLAARVGVIGFLARELPAQIPQVLSEVEL